MKKMISLTLAIGIIIGILAGCSAEKGSAPTVKSLP